MSILWAGTSLADLLVKGSAILNPTTGDISVNVSEGFYLNKEGDADSFSPKFTPQTDFWVSQILKCGSELYSTNAVLWKWVDPNGQEALRIVMHASGPMCKLQKKTGSSTWTDLATALFSLTTARVRVDFHIVMDSGGKFTMWVDGVPCIDFDGDTLPYNAATISYMAFGGHYVAHISTHSAIIVADEDTRGLTFIQRIPNGNGSQTAWTGSYTDVDETGINDADLIKSTVSGDIETFTFPDLDSGLDSRMLRAVVLSARIQGSGAPGGANGVARVGSTNYEVPGEFQTSPIFNCQQWIMDVNPATSAEWLGSEFNAAEFGVKSI